MRTKTSRPTGHTRSGCCSTTAGRFSKRGERSGRGRRASKMLPAHWQRWRSAALSSTSALLIDLHNWRGINDYPGINRALGPHLVADEWGWRSNLNLREADRVSAPPGFRTDRSAVSWKGTDRFPYLILWGGSGFRSGVSPASPHTAPRSPRQWSSQWSGPVPRPPREPDRQIRC